MKRKKFLFDLLFIVLVILVFFLSWNYQQKRLIYQNIEQLKSSDSTGRQRAIAALRKIGKPAVEPLIFALQFDNVHAKSIVMETICTITRKKELVQTTIKLEEESLNLKKGSAEALGLIADPRAVSPLVSLLNYKNPDVRECAVTALGKIGKPAIPALSTAVMGNDPETVLIVVKTLGLTKDPEAVKPIINGLKKHSKELWIRFDYIEYETAFANALGEIGKPALNSLTELSKGSDFIAKRVAIRSMGKIPAPETVKVLISLLSTEKDELYDLTVESLKDMGKMTTIDLAEALQDENPFIRRGAARALGMSGDPEAVGPLLKAFREGDPQTRKETLGVLACFRDRRLTDLMMDCLFSEEEEISNIAATGLINLGKPAVQALLKEIKTGAEKRRKTAYDVLVRFGRTSRENQDDLGCQEILGILEKEYKQAKGQYKESLESLIVLYNAEQPVNYYLKSLNDENTKIRRYAAYRLGEIRDPKAVKPLVAALNDSDREVKGNAIVSLGEIGGAETVEPLLKLMSCEDDGFADSAAMSLKNVGVPAAPALIKKLRDKNEKVRDRAYSALANSSEVEITDLLGKAFNDGDVNFRLKIIELIGSSTEFPGYHNVNAALADTDWRIRKLAVECLSLFPHNDSTEIMVEKLKDREIQVRISAAYALGVWQNPSALNPLNEAFNDENPLMRLAVVDSVSYYLSEKATPLKLRALKDSDKEIRKLAFASIPRDYYKRNKKILLSALERDPEFVMEFIERLIAVEIPEIDAIIVRELDKNSDINKTLDCLYSNNPTLVNAAGEWCKKHNYKMVLDIKDNVSIKRDPPLTEE